jgi:N-acetylglucosamine-6-sulfatase
VMIMLRRLLAPSVTVAITVVSCTGSSPSIRTTSPPSPTTRPSIVIILTDDQRWDTLRFMPVVRSQIVRQGVRFRNAFVVNPTCCPSRTSLLTGMYSHSTGVYGNRGPNGGFAAFDDRSTLATWLQDSGYHTALFGKYLNGYTKEHSSYVPPGWNKWEAFATRKGNGAYYDYSLSIDGERIKLGDSPSDYSTTKLAADVVDYIHSTPGPLFIYFAPYAPHAPNTPPPNVVAPKPGPHHPPSYDEANVSDKPRWVQEKPRLDVTADRRIDNRTRRQWATLQSVDRGIGQILQALRTTGRIDQTMVVFSSDNGLAHGEHRLVGKESPYEESIRVPLAIRYDDWNISSVRHDELVLNIDLAPTLAEVAGISPPPLEGRSLMPLIEGRDTDLRRNFLIEHWYKKFGVPNYCAVRGTRFKYIVHSTREQELYDLKKDSFELHNVMGDSRYDGVMERMRRILARLCSPAPPRVFLEPSAGR